MCTSPFFTAESMWPVAGIVSFLNASQFEEGRALFIALVTEPGVAVELQCGSVEAESSPITGPNTPDLSVAFGIADTSECPSRLLFAFQTDSESQTVGTTAGS